MWSYLLSDLAPAAAGARSLHILNKSTFDKTHNVASCYDEMINHADVK